MELNIKRPACNATASVQCSNSKEIDQELTHKGSQELDTHCTLCVYGLHCGRELTQFGKKIFNRMTIGLLCVAC